MKPLNTLVILIVVVNVFIVDSENKLLKGEPTDKHAAIERRI